MSDRIPAGYTQLHWAYTNGTTIVIGGVPVDDHNCDQMGCGQDHVLARFEIPEPQRAALAREVEEVDLRRMPILQAARLVGGPDSLPFAQFAAKTARCLKNHSQTPERLAARGGVSFVEALAILEDRDWPGSVPNGDEEIALRRLRLAGAM